MAAKSESISTTTVRNTEHDYRVLWQVLAEEYRQIHLQKPAVNETDRRAFDERLKTLTEERRQQSEKDQAKWDEQQLRDFIRRYYCGADAPEQAALCLSGGGIRSATFCLGVLQRLAETPSPAGSTTVDAPTPPQPAGPHKSLLEHFHYLSTVSGGGYIGSWLSAWQTRDPNAIKKLGEAPGPTSRSSPSPSNICANTACT